MKTRKINEDEYKAVIVLGAFAVDRAQFIQVLGGDVSPQLNNAIHLIQGWIRENSDT